MEQPAVQKADEKPERKKAQKTGENVTRLYVFYGSEDGNGMTDFASKEDLDTWYESTNVTILKIIRGFEKPIKKRKIYL